MLGEAPVTFGQVNPEAFITPGEAPAGIQTTAERSPSSYLDYLYTWLLGFVGLAALFAMVYGGVYYIFSGVSEGGVKEAKRWITNGIIGLIIAGGSYLLLRTINPDLVRKFDIQSIIQKTR